MIGEGATVAFWWVNHSQSWKAETGRGILWSPLTKSNGDVYLPYLNMGIARPGDIVFSYAEGRIGHVGIVDGEATPSPKPDYASQAPWSDNGLLLPVTFSALAEAIVPKDQLERIAPLLPAKHSPIRLNGSGNLSYLSLIPDELGALLLELGNVDAKQLRAALARDPVAEDIDSIASDPEVRPTDRLQLSKARIGQGIFRKSVLAIEPKCRVTGINTVSLLRASHIKPWRCSTNVERLDGANGLMLAPHIDLLFDRFLISFTDNGELLFSQNLDKSVLEKWHLDTPASPKPFNQAQQTYLATHRQLMA